MMRTYNNQMSIKSQQQTAQRNLRIKNLRKAAQELPTIRRRSEELQFIFKRSKTNNFEQQVRGRLSKSKTIIERPNEDQDDFDSFFANYELLEKIGEGCNAIVFKYSFKKTGKIYAVKKIKLESEHMASMKKNFITLKQLNHSSICRYKALFIKKQMRTAFLIMEYLPYPSLADIQIQDEEELRTIVLEILEALAYLHRHNICHRDIKPENILYNRDDKKIKIIDFGISKKTFLKGQRRDMLTIIGTNQYLAPQIFTGGGYDERVDLWALGITIYKLVCGHNPFESQYYSDTIKNIKNGTFTFQGDVWSKYSSNLKNFISSFLKKMEQRMTIEDAQRHLWMLQSPPSPNKLRRMSSHDILVNQDFHHEFKNRLWHTVAKEEGSLSNEEGRILTGKIELSDCYNLQDSDDQKHILTPQYRPALRKFNTLSNQQRDNLFLEQKQTIRSRNYSYSFQLI